MGCSFKNLFLLKPNSQQWENIQIFTHFTVLMKHGIHTKTLVIRIKIKTRTIITEKKCVFSQNTQYKKIDFFYMSP